MDLIIVESPSKAKTITKYLKGKYKVDASGGHVRDLPERTLGVKINSNFEPEYEITSTKKDVIKRLTDEAKKAGRVYLATDPDREGEAISWHLQTVLGLDENAENRIEFNEISPAAVQRALKSPRKINYNLVDAQQARRVLDRLVGYKLSPLLNNRIQDGLSAGRVQSVALRLIVDREREIQAFNPDEYWSFTATLRDLKGEYQAFKATYQLKKNGESIGKDVAEKIEKEVKGGSFKVTKVKKGVTKQHAPAPFTTSSLQQDAANKFPMTSPEIMMVAQHLYEGMEINGEHVAFITYIRTDSVRVSHDAQQNALEFIKKEYGAEYVPEKPNFYATKKGAQDAHEAIRPINLEVTPASVKTLLDKKHYNVYKLIYDRFIASQMTEAQYNTMQVETESAGYTFKASGRALLFAGYTAAYQDIAKEEDEDASSLFPPVNEGDSLNLEALVKEQKFTRPPMRYTDASLVKAMEDKGIGRPSTYASIISVLNKRQYVEKEGKYMVPTDVAYKITDLLVKYFANIMDIGFTAHMEDDLDKIEEGGCDWHKIIADFYPDFKEKLGEAAFGDDEPTDIICEKCGHTMIRRSGKYGKYLACSNYPACSHKISEEEKAGIACPQCGGEMVVKSGKYGKFIACSNYPDCKCMLPINAKIIDQKCSNCGNDKMVLKKGKNGEYSECPKCGEKLLESGEKLEKTEGICPECGKPMRRMQSKRGKIFYGCTGYPACKFMSWDAVTGTKCPQCGSYLVKKNGQVQCSDRNCAYTEELPTDEN